VLPKVYSNEPIRSRTRRFFSFWYSIKFLSFNKIDSQVFLFLRDSRIFCFPLFVGESVSKKWLYSVIVWTTSRCSIKIRPKLHLQRVRRNLIKIEWDNSYKIYFLGRVFTSSSSLMDWFVTKFQKLCFPCYPINMFTSSFSKICSYFCSFQLRMNEVKTNECRPPNQLLRLRNKKK